MTASIDLTLDDLYTDCGNLFQGIVGIDPNTTVLVPVVVGQDNRVAFPNVPFMLMQAFRAGQLGTGVNSYPNGGPAPTDPQLQKTEQDFMVRLQLDCYGPKSEAWAAMIVALWRNFYACDRLTVCQPLYGDAPFQGALVAGEEQYEERWTVNLFLQYNPVTTVDQQSATAVKVTVINVDERYPP